MSKKNTLAILTLLALFSASCGKVEPRKKITQPITEPTRYTDAEFNALCMESSGRLAGPGNAFCITRVSKELPPAHPSATYEIVPKFFSGQYVVSSGEGSVTILYNGAALINVGERIPSPVGSGEPLFFFINQAGYKNVVATIWSCFDKVKPDGSIGMRRVFCPTNGVVPGT